MGEMKRLPYEENKMLTHFTTPCYLGVWNLPAARALCWRQHAACCLEEWSLTVLALLNVFWKDAGGEYQDTQILISSTWQYCKFFFLWGNTDIKWMHVIISNETWLHFLFVTTSSSTEAILDICNCIFSDDFLVRFSISSAVICAFFFFSVAAAFPHPRVVDAFCTPFFSSGPQYRDNWDPGTKKPNTSVICAFVAGTRGSLAAQHIFLQTNAALVILYLYNYCKSISPASYHTNTATTGCYCCGLCALIVDLQLGTEVWNKI